MYVTVSWQVDAAEAVASEIDKDVLRAFGTLQRVRLLLRTYALRPVTTSDLPILVDTLDGLEQLHQLQFGYTLFVHTDGDAFRCSEPFDAAAAHAVTKT